MTILLTGNDRFRLSTVSWRSGDRSAVRFRVELQRFLRLLLRRSSPETCPCQFSPTVITCSLKATVDTSSTRHVFGVFWRMRSSMLVDSSSYVTGPRGQSLGHLCWMWHCCLLRWSLGISQVVSTGLLFTFDEVTLRSLCICLAICSAIH